MKALPYQRVIQRIAGNHPPGQYPKLDPNIAPCSAPCMGRALYIALQSRKIVYSIYIQ